MKSALDRWAGLREQRAGVRSARARSNSEGGAAAGVGGEDPVFGSLSPERARVLLIIAARSSACAMLVLAAAVLITLLTTHSALTGASGAIAVGWFAIHQVPVVVSSTSLALLPLVPTVAVLWLTMRDCAHAVSPQASRADLGWIVGAAVIGPLLITAICLAVVQDAAVTVPVQAPSSLSAFCTVGALHLVAAITGIATRRNPMRDLIASGLPDWVYSGARIAVGSLWRLLAAAAAVVLVSLVLHWSVLGDIYSAAGGFAGRLGLTVLSLLYLPNVAVAASSVLLGADVHIGVGALSVFSVTGAPVPAVPILAAVPGGPAAGWWPALLVIPAVVGVRGGLRCARESADVARAPWATLFSAALSALALAVSGLFAGGEVGSFGEIGPGVAVTAALVFAWFTVTGYAGLLW
ncbi:MAG: hypothetical protein J2P18_14965, partial [Nocardia sp.]|nr:hypothetical protein [Nocardia sp.]